MAGLVRGSAPQADAGTGVSVKGDLVKFRLKKPFDEQKTVHVCTQDMDYECQQQLGVKCIVA